MHHSLRNSAYRVPRAYHVPRTALHAHAHAHVHVHVERGRARVFAWLLIMSHEINSCVETRIQMTRKNVSKKRHTGHTVVSTLYCTAYRTALSPSL